MTPDEEKAAKIRLLDAEGKRRAGEAQWQTEMNYIAKAGGFTLEQIDHLLKEQDSAVDRIYNERRAAERKAWREMKGRS